MVWWEKAMFGSKGKPPECGLERENRRLGQRGSHRSVVWQGKTAAWVKGKATGVWPGKGKLPPGSKRKPSECGLARENRRLGQRESHRSVAWKEKPPPGSKGKPPECGLTRKNVAWVKGKAVGVWSGGKKRWLGQRERHRSVVWWEKSPPGSKRKPSECGLVGKTAAWVKETPPQKARQ